MPKPLDYSIQSLTERKQLVEQILAETPEPNEAYLETMANYLINCLEKEQKKERKILTENRMVTINKREISYEGLTEQFLNGEDGVSNLITHNKNIIFQPKVTISAQDIAEIPFLAQLRESIKRWEALSSGRNSYLIQQTLIELRKDQYIIKNAYRKPIVASKVPHGAARNTELPFDEEIDQERNVSFSGISFLNPTIIKTILSNYEALAHSSEGRIQSDLYYVMYDFNLLLDAALEEHPFYKHLVALKLSGLSNVQIQEQLEKDLGRTHSIEYISALWCNKIPKLISHYAEEDWLIWYYTFKERGVWKRCSKCGQIKLAHSRFFSINKTSKDGYYSICKKCRNAAKRERRKADG